MKVLLKATIGLLLCGLVCFVSCSKEGITGSGDNVGKGGSLSRFTISGSHLYLIDQHYLITYNLVNPTEPVKTASTLVGFDIETIYPYKNFLFIGGRNGFYIYNIADPNNPQKLGLASHTRSCDPVVATDSIAYVTLKGSGACGPAVSGLYIYDIKNITSPKLTKTMELTDPAGLGIQDRALYVCCGNGGLKVFDLKNPLSPALIATKTEGNYLDVIPYNGILICYTLTNLILYDITDPFAPKLIKMIS